MEQYNFDGNEVRNRKNKDNYSFIKPRREKRYTFETLL